ncbi:SURF1 family protein [Sphingobium algorifonticola]|uniref:SURF1-like protein n=1 Tax=Sphingobium algorifonticola TaxID=2008318 RepID=A0A437JDP6_9SPHN|nr:SURF1 family protein [Sphingobium algorifonticola]RVT43742.1 SURF1 family protein [Sphingobium algorifonticola]
MTGAPRPAGWLAVVGGVWLLLFVGLIALGTWQVQRRTWKQALIEQVNARIHAPPVTAPGPAAWPAVTAASDGYRRVTVRGHFRPDGDTLVQAVTALGSGYWVMAPLETEQGFTVLVNRGFVPPERRGDYPRLSGTVTITGLLRLTEPNGGFLRRNDPAADRWHSRDVAAIAAARGLRTVAPYFIDAEREPDDRNGDPALPVAGLTVVVFSDNHLVYALTWYGLAILLVVVGFLFGKEEWRRHVHAPKLRR